MHSGLQNGIQGSDRPPQFFLEGPLHLHPAFIVGHPQALFIKKLQTQTLGKRHTLAGHFDTQLIGHFLGTSGVVPVVGW